MSIFGTNTKINNTNKRLQKIADGTSGQAAKIGTTIGDILDQGATGTDVDNFRTAAQNGVSKVGNFSYDLAGKTQELLDPTIAQQQAAASREINNSSANAGGLFSSDTGKALSDRAASIAAQGYQNALNAALTDQSTQQNAWGTQQTLNQQGELAGLNAMGDLAQLGQNSLTNEANANATALQNAYDTANSVAAQIAKNNLGKRNGWEDITGAIGDVGKTAAQIAGAFAG